MTLTERAVARVLAGAVGAATAGVAGAAVAFASGLIGPLGSQAASNRRRGSGRRGPSPWVAGRSSRCCSWR